ALYKSMDELYDSEVTITIQQHHWKAWDKRNPSITPKDHGKKAEARHENIKVAIHPDFSDQEITIGETVSIKAQTELCTLLKRNLDLFAWQPSDMTGVPLSIVEHRLNIQEGYFLVRQKKRGQASERAKAIQVKMAEQDEEKMALHTSHGVYWYTKMPFGLKNAGATYQRLVDKAFETQIDLKKMDKGINAVGSILLLLV
nr:reverse transcriptase domain-containing protein [Tanacetum cinerariifolium]